MYAVQYYLGPTYHYLVQKLYYSTTVYLSRGVEAIRITLQLHKRGILFFANGKVGDY